jgi:hypothetical protein
MRRLLFFVICAIHTTAYTQTEGIDSAKKLDRFNKGETLSFDLGYGWFTLGKAELVVSDSLHTYADRSCYKVDISGRTTGLLGAFSKVDDSWGGLVDSESMLPLSAYADLHEGKYQRKEDIVYDHDNGLITIEMTKRHKKRPTKYYDFEGEIYDLISGYLKLRNLDYTQLQKGDTIKFRAFYDEIYYDFGVLFDGIEKVKTEVGKLKAYRVIPIIPENKIFPGTNPITAWISADPNQLPLKVEAEMFFGHAYVELTDYKNIKFGPDFQD